MTFEKLKCDKCGKEVGYYSISGTFDFYCNDCEEEIHKYHVYEVGYLIKEEKEIEK